MGTGDHKKIPAQKQHIKTPIFLAHGVFTQPLYSLHKSLQGYQWFTWGLHSTNYIGQRHYSHRRCAPLLSATNSAWPRRWSSNRQVGMGCQGENFPKNSDAIFFSWSTLNTHPKCHWVKGGVVSVGWKEMDLVGPVSWVNDMNKNPPNLYKLFGYQGRKTQDFCQVLPWKSMRLIYLPTWMVDFLWVNVGKYTSPMDLMVYIYHEFPKPWKIKVLAT